MKQVTGATNNKPEIKNVSIRLRLDGHSFSEEKLDIPAKEKKTVEIEVLTGKTMLVPREVFDAKVHIYYQSCCGSMSFFNIV